VDPPIGRQPNDGVATTASGRKIDADAIVWAAGIKIATEFVAQSFPEAIERDGRLKTDPYLRLQGHPTIFVAGDVTNLPERRLAIIAGLHAPAVTKSLTALAQSREAKARSLQTATSWQRDGAADGGDLRASWRTHVTAFRAVPRELLGQGHQEQGHARRSNPQGRGGNRLGTQPHRPELGLPALTGADERSFKIPNSESVPPSPGVC
jgi:hypothetical protein